MRISTPGALVALLLAASAAAAQQAPTLPTSAQVLPEALAQHDQGNYGAAIARYLTVPPSDTSYARVQSELALSYLANKQYTEAAAAARRAIARQVHEVQAYNVAADAEENLEHMPQALQLYTEGLRRFPYNYSLWYNQALAQDKAGDAKGALLSLQRCLELAPLHASSHYYLGYLALRQGQTARALLSILTSLALDPEGSHSQARLVIAEQLSANAVPLEAKEKLPPLSDNAAFQELDELLNAKVALRKDYVSKVKFDANVVKQAQLLVEKFPAAPAGAADPWLRLYGPVVEALRRDDNLTPFTYLLLSSANDRKAAQWVKSNKSRTSKMGDAVTAALVSFREYQLVTQQGQPVRTQAWFNNDGQLRGLGAGTLVGGKMAPHGPWQAIDEQGALSTEGSFSATGQRIGTWRSYHANGQLERVSAYDDQGELHGPFQEFHDNGALSIEATYAHGKVDGTTKLYSYCGALHEVRTYRNDAIEGESIYYFADGRELGRTQYKANKRQGRDLNYYADGQLEAEYAYVNDLKQGPFAVYYADKAVDKKGAYDQGELHGPYQAFYPNGQLYQTGTYDHGKSVGQWREYYRTGKLSSDVSYNAAGELHGKYLDYDDDGTLLSTFVYDQGRVTQITYVDRAGKEVMRTEVKKGKTAVQAPQRNGQRRYTGTYLNGQQDGEWRWFHRDGALQTVRHYVAGKQQGVAEEYYATGRLKSRQSYLDGEEDGYYEQHYEDGPLRQTGFYQHGQQQGLWRDYYADGRVSEEYYYHDGVLQGPSRAFTPTGQLTGEREYDNGRLQLSTALDSTGRELSRLVVTPQTKELLLRYPGGQPRYRVPLLCYEEHGAGTWFAPGGTPELTLSLNQGRRDGDYKATGERGKPSAEGRYRRGSREGQWKTYYASGALLSQGLYRNGSQDGEWTSYFENGKLEIIMQYADGTLDGPMRQYNMLGELLVEKRYEQGRLTGFRGPGPDGQATGEFQPFDTGTGPVKTQFANGKPALDETYLGAYWQGPRTYYYSTGQVYRRAQNKDGLLSGQLETYYPDGKLQEQEYYLHDERHGRCRYFRPDGTLEREESYRSGERYGPTVYYNAQGKPLKTDVYWNTYVYGSK